MKKFILTVMACAAFMSLTACNKAPEEIQSFVDIEMVRPACVDRVVFSDLASLEKRADFVVVGRFTGDVEQNVISDYNDFFGKDIISFVTSTCTVEVEKVLAGDVNIGDNLQVSQAYGIVDDRLLTYSELTPMQSGDEWLFFLSGSEEDGYWCCGDSDGRYPVPSAENAPMPLSSSPELGVYSKQSFNQSIYDEILEKYDF